MGFAATVLKVIIASPGDVNEERRIVTEEIYRWNNAHAEARRLVLQPVKWETHSTPRLGQAPQTELNEQIAENADILIGVFGTRVGTPTAFHVSGTVEEIKNHVAAGKLAKVYFSDLPVPPSSIDPGQYKALQAFKEECQSSGLYATYADIASFQRDFKQHLDIELNAPRFRWLTARDNLSMIKTTTLSEDASILLTKAAQTDKGTIAFVRTLAGISISIEREQMTDGTSRSAARWKAAIEELRKLDYAKESSSGSGYFELTHAGYEAARKAEGLEPLHVLVRTIGPPEQQGIAVKANRPVALKQIDYLHSTGACVASQRAEMFGEDLEVVLSHQQLTELNNSDRPDKNPGNSSGPALLRLALEANGDRHQITLPVHLNSQIVSNTLFVTLTGMAENSFV